MKQKKENISLWFLVDNPEMSDEFIAFLLAGLIEFNKEKQVYYETNKLEHAQNTVSSHFTGLEQIKVVSYGY